ncbi:MAG: Gfo/Idh/MocA family oxidoreductase [Leptospiraceae bacterium]|nr:Gfo/Idh/MocA family oxidoreductase [Leptospiraceae bacterium]
MRKIAVALVGAGNVSGVHMKAWKKISEVEVLAVCDLIEERAKRFARNWRIKHVYTDFDELLEDFEGEIIDICTPPQTHMPMSIKAMDRGFNVVLEKPMSISVEESENIIKEYQKRKDEIKLLVIHNYLFSPSMLEIKQILLKNKVEILGADIRILHKAEDEMLSDRDHWIHSLPGGRFGECLIHPVYILQDLLGKLNIRDVYFAKKSGYEHVKYDELYVTFNSDEAKVGSVYISFNSPRETSFPTIRIYGKNMLLNFDGSNSTLTIQKHLGLSKVERVIDSFNVSAQVFFSTLKNVFKVLTNKWKTGHEVMFKLFISSLTGSHEMPYTPEEAFRANKIYLEVLERLK